MPIRVVIVDGHGIVRRGLRRLLEREPAIEVVGDAGDRHSALAKVAASEPDVVIVDPQLDGESILAALQSVSPRAAVLVFADESRPAEIEEAIADGAAGVVLKSAAPQLVVMAVQAAADGHLYLQPEVTRAVVSRLLGRTGADGIIVVTAREMEILQMIANGMSTSEAAAALDRSQATVKTHIRSAFKKLGARHRAHAVAMALRLRLIR